MAFLRSVQIDYIVTGNYEKQIVFPLMYSCLTTPVFYSIDFRKCMRAHVFQKQERRVFNNCSDALRLFFHLAVCHAVRAELPGK